MSQPKPSSLKLPNKSIKQNLQLLWQLMAGFRLPYILGITALLCATIIQYLVPLVANGAIDYAISENLNGDKASFAYKIFANVWDKTYLKEHLWIPALIMVVLTFFSGVFTYLKGKGTAYASDGIARRLKERLYDHLQRLPTEYHDRAEPGDLIQRCTSDVETIRLALSSQVVEVSNAFILVGTAFPIMLLLDGRMTLLSFVLLPPIVLFGFMYFRRVRERFLEVDEAEGRVTSVVQENLTGLRVVRAFCRQQFEIEKFKTPNKEYRDKSLHLLKLMAIYWSISDFIVLVQNGIVLITGIYFVSNGSLSIGSLFAFIMFFNLLFWPVRQMGRILTDFGKSLVALGRVGEILEVAEETKPANESIYGKPLLGSIELDQLVYHHRAEGAGINGISCRIEAGETLAILGPSGSGKTTLMNLLLRLYDYQKGAIRVDGVELKNINRQWLRSQFAVVMQEPFLFSKTIKANIRFGHSSANVSQVSDAAKMAHVHETINAFPQGYDTLVGERGVTLSGGQRQRVALARALLKKAPILLLDDALSAVDSETEEAILTALKERHGKMTTIVIAHRLSTLAHADRIIVLDNGKIIQEGNHEKLIKEGGLYRRLWMIQNRLEDEFLKTEEGVV